MIPPLNTNWNVLYTAPRAEKQVKERIAALGVECFLPLHRTPRVWSDRVKIVEVPLFSSYISRISWARQPSMSFVRVKKWKFLPGP